jgi:hypothetical protein
MRYLHFPKIQGLLVSIRTRLRPAGLLVVLVLFSLLAGASGQYDSDGDGVVNGLDDCPYAAGSSTIDRNGCPDADADGTSDLTDDWTSLNPSFALEFSRSSTVDVLDAAHSPDGEFVAIRDNQYVRIENASTQAVVRTSGQLGSGNWGSRVAWSPDGSMIASAVGNNGVTVLWSSNLTPLSSNVAPSNAGNVRDVAFFPNGTAFLAVGEGWSGSGKVYVADPATGTVWHDFAPNGDTVFSSVALTPDGSRAAVGGAGKIYVINTSSWQVVRTINHGSQNVRGVDVSPDGVWISGCDDTGWAYQTSALRVWNLETGANVMTKTGTSRCSETRFSPDASQVAYAFHFYSTDGAAVTVFDVSSGAFVDRVTARPAGDACSGQNTGSNVCGRMYGLSWHPNGMQIVSVMGEDNEGVYYWTSDPDPDLDGWNSTDQGDGRVDAFPDDGTQWNDSDGDAFGDNPAPALRPDACVDVAGNSTSDRFGCPDADGDGYSDPDVGWGVDDGADLWPEDPEQWEDIDGDGRGDNYLYGVQQGSMLRIDQRGDEFPNDATQWNDTDGDGWGDNWGNATWTQDRPSAWPGAYVEEALMPDRFPLDRTQWMDSDNDGFGDNPNSGVADGCPSVPGNSIFDRLGCPDADGDGWSDPTVNWTASAECDQADAFPFDASQWCDSDGDGYGDNESGTTPDQCPNQGGTSTRDVYGCADRDGDGYSNGGDSFPDDASQWSDTDGDNRGDNPNGSNPDLYPEDPTQWADSDGDGYGDNPSGTNGDRFPSDPRQWADSDGDGFGDNLIDEDGDGLSEAGDVCPLLAGNSNAPVSRGCPDTDSDGYTDPVDAFPTNPFQWNDTDGDGYGDNSAVNGGDDCITEFGTSNTSGVFGCPDRDFDGRADHIDAFPDDISQWADVDGDGYGDNYAFEMVSVEDPERPGFFLLMREETGDWMPENPSQWSDRDGDGFGDNSTGFQGDQFPWRATQWADFDGDGYGDNSVFNLTNPTYQPDDCYKEYGRSTLDRFGCPDSDEDGVSDLNDPCPYDPSVSDGIRGQVVCSITAPTDDANGAGGGGAALAAQVDLTKVVLLGSVGLVAGAVLLSMIGRRAGRRAVLAERERFRQHDRTVDEEEARRKEWIRYYVAQGQLEEARALGWMGEDVATSTAAVPQWKQYEMEQQAAQQAALPSMPDLDSL